MTGAELIALAKREDANPYYLAYALATGATSCPEAFRRDGGNHLFMSWNNERWNEQAKAEGLHRDVVGLQVGAFERHCEVCAAAIKEEKAS